MNVKNRRILFVFLVLGAGFVFVFSWPRKQQENGKKNSTNKFSTALTLTNSNNKSVDVILKKTTATTATKESGKNDREERLKRAIEIQNKPINFYGRVVDQDDNGIPNVRIILSIREWHSNPAATTFPKFDRDTGNDGGFSLENQNGDSLTIVAIEKSGYELEPKAKRSFGFNTSEQFRSEPNFPVIFKMWKTNIHEQLITGKKSFQIEPDGRSYILNLNNGTITESGKGDLKVWIKYPKEVVRGQTNDWSCEVTVVDGGLLEEKNDDSSMYLAPVEDYFPAFRLHQQIKGGQRGSSGTRRFYLRLKNGQEFGRITFELQAPYNNQVPGLIRIDYAINPSGSHILR